jgi:membrane protein
LAPRKEEDWFVSMDRRILHWMWRPAQPRTGMAHYLVYVLKVAYLSVRSSYLDRLPFQANALTFITLLGLVPALAISFSLAKGLGFSEKLKDLVINEYTASQAEVLKYIISYVENTKVGTLGMVGLVMLVITLVLAISSVEETFNRVWEAPQSRNWLRKFTDYLSIMVICPMLVLAATTVWAAVSNYSVVQWMLDSPVLGTVASFGLSLGPFVLLTAAFIFIYLFLPNTRVPLISALVAGLVAAFLWWLVQSIYISFQVGVARYNALYGGFASLPLFMVWIQLSWTILLFGAELAHAQHICSHGPLPKSILPPLNPAQREALALGVMQKVAQRFQAGGQPWSVGDLARSLKVAKAEVWSVVDDLGEVGMVAELSRDGRVMPGRNLDNVLICQVLGAVRGSLDQGRAPGTDQEDPALVELMGKVIAAEEKALGQQRLMELVGPAEPPPAASCTAPAERE